jgi:serine/threonine protein kinase
MDNYFLIKKYQRNVYLFQTPEEKKVVKVVEKESKEPDFYKLFDSPYVVEMKNCYEPKDKTIFKREKVIELEAMDGTLYELFLNEELKYNSGAKLYNLYLDLHLGLQEMHSKNVVHRDISSVNILYKDINGRKLYKYCDFDLSKLTFSKEKKFLDLFELNATLYDLLIHGTEMKEIEDLRDAEEIKEHISNYPNTTDKYLKKIIETMKYVFNSEGKATLDDVFYRI